MRHSLSRMSFCSSVLGFVFFEEIERIQRERAEKINQKSFCLNVRRANVASKQPFDDFYWLSIKKPKSVISINETFTTRNSLNRNLFQKHKQ